MQFQVVNALLTQMDKLKSSPNVIILTTSNITAAIGKPKSILHSFNFVAYVLVCFVLFSPINLILMIRSVFVITCQSTLHVRTEDVASLNGDVVNSWFYHDSRWKLETSAIYNASPPTQKKAPVWAIESQIATKLSTDFCCQRRH